MTGAERTFADVDVADQIRWLLTPPHPFETTAFILAQANVIDALREEVAALTATITRLQVSP